MTTRSIEDRRVLYDIQESASALNVSPRTVAALVARGELRSVTIGRRRLIPRQAIEDFVAERVAAALDVDTSSDDAA